MEIVTSKWLYQNQKGCSESIEDRAYYVGAESLADG